MDEKAVGNEQEAQKGKTMKATSLFLIFFIYLAICACENPMMAAILQTKTVIFDSNGGSYVPPQSLLRNEKISKPQAPVKTGYFFNGWFTDNWSFKNKWDFNNIPEADMILYAGWDNTADNIVISSASVTVTGPVTGGRVIKTALTDGEGYTCGLVTWSPDPNDIYFKSSTQYTATVTLTARKGYTFEGLEAATINDFTANIDYIDASTAILSYSFQATSEKAIDDIKIVSDPIFMTYTHGSELALNGLRISITYTDHNIDDVGLNDYGFSTVPAEGTQLICSVHNGEKIKVILGELYAYTNSVLTVNKAMPGADDFDISGRGPFTYDGSPKTVTVKANKTGIGNVTVKYYIGNTEYTAPINAGDYTVTLNIAEGDNYLSVSGLSAGTLTINKKTPALADFQISGTGTFTENGNARTVIVEPNSNIYGMGAVTVKYNGSTTAPSAPETYNVTFDVADGINYNLRSGLNAGQLIINPAVAQVNDQYFSTITEAIKSVTGTPDVPEEIKIVGNINLTGTDVYTISNGKHIKLTVNAGDNYTITAPAGTATEALSLFTVNANASLILGEEGSSGKLTLVGNGNNSTRGHRGVSVNGGNLIINDNVTIEGFKNMVGTGTENSGGGVYVTNKGSFTLNGGTIKNCSAYSGGGVHVIDGTFNMLSGSIEENTATLGGGVCLYTGTKFTMHNGDIKNNSAEASGGGVYIYQGTTYFNMIDGTISGNKSIASGNTVGGGGVFIDGGNFIMSGGKIMKNTAEKKNSDGTGGNGGGVYERSGNFEMSGGYVYGFDGESLNPPGIPNVAEAAVDKGDSIYIKNGTAKYSGISGLDEITTTDYTLPYYH